MRFCILGTGGLGSVIGGCLANSGQDVTMIGRPAHMNAIKENGLKISGLRGDFHITENMTPVTSPDEAEGEFDYLILLVKGKDSETAMAEAKDLVKRCKCVFSLQNGVGKESRMQEWAGADKVIGASTIEGGCLISPGVVTNEMTTPTTAFFGELEGGTSDRVDAVTQAFTDAGLPSKAMDNIMAVLWEKLMQIGTASSWCVSTLGTRLFFSDGLLVNEGAVHYVAIAKDLLSVFKAMGYSPQNYYAPMSQFKEIDELGFDKAVEKMKQLGERFKKQGAQARTSMHEDFVQGRKTEIDFLILPFIEKAKELGVKIPVVETVYRIIKVQDAYLK